MTMVKISMNGHLSPGEGGAVLVSQHTHQQTGVGAPAPRDNKVVLETGMVGTSVQCVEQDHGLHMTLMLGWQHDLVT